MKKTHLFALATAMLAASTSASASASASCPLPTPSLAPAWAQTCFAAFWPDGAWLLHKVNESPHCFIEGQQETDWYVPREVCVPQ